MLRSGIRLARADGEAPADEMAAVHEVSATVAYAHIFDAPFPVEDARAKWASHEGEVWIARREEALVGFATATGAELDGLFVLPVGEGAGTGAALLTAVAGVTRLWVLEDAHAARCWYKKRGWRAANAKRRTASGNCSTCDRCRRYPMIILPFLGLDSGHTSRCCGPPYGRARGPL